MSPEVFIKWFPDILDRQLEALRNLWDVNIWLYFQVFPDQGAHFGRSSHNVVHPDWRGHIRCFLVSPST